MCSTQKIILEMYDNQLFDIYEHEELNCLAERDLRFEEQSIHSFYNNAIENFSEKFQGGQNFLLDDILNCSKDLKFCIGNLFLYKPYINNPLNAVERIGDMEMFPNYQNIFDRRYNIYSSITPEKLYNYWDRIGDLINLVFNVIENETKIYFTSVINCLPDIVRTSDNYRWLIEFKEHDFTIFNRMRKNVVHYQQLETQYAGRHLDAAFNREAMERLQAEKESYPNFYKEQLAKTITGFEKTIKLINDYNALLSNNEQ